MHTAQGGEQARSLSYETGSLVRIDLTRTVRHRRLRPAGPVHIRQRRSQHRVRARSGERRCLDRKGVVLRRAGPSGVPLGDLQPAEPRPLRRPTESSTPQTSVASSALSPPARCASVYAIDFEPHVPDDGEEDALPERVVERSALLHAAEHDELSTGLHLHRGPKARDQLTILSHRDDTQPSA